MNCLTPVLMIVFVMTLLVDSANSANGMKLVMLPVQVDQSEEVLSMEYGYKIQEALKIKYSVSYGADVEAELEKIYAEVEESDIACDSSVCHREIALAFGTPLVACAAVKKISSGYILSLAIRDVSNGEITYSKTLPCKNCDAFELLNVLPELVDFNIQSDSEILIAQQPVSSDRLAMAALVLNSKPSGAKITINGKDSGVTPYQGLSHYIGERLDIRIAMDRYASIDKQIVISDPITKEIVELQPSVGEVLVFTEPFVEGVAVSINGKPVGLAPYRAKLNAGNYNIRIRILDGQVYEVGQVVKQGEISKARFEVMPKDEKLRVYSVGGVEFKMNLIPSGEYTMGSNDGEPDERPIHRVKIPRFYIMEYPVGGKLYQQCVDERKCHNISFDYGKSGVSRVSWHDVVDDFIPWLNNKTGKIFRLPSESEWEYAAGKVVLDTHEIFSEKKPNAFGLYFMLMDGPSWQWVQDCYIGNCVLVNKTGHINLLISRTLPVINHRS